LLGVLGGLSEPACPSRARETAPVPAKTETAPRKAAIAPTKPDPFVATVRPVLVARCAPCHEPGGKMYEKLPFDRPETLSLHREGALRRLKGEDRAAFEAWLATLPAP
jgi:hypothetical protein